MQWFAQFAILKSETTDYFYLQNVVISIVHGIELPTTFVFASNNHENNHVHKHWSSKKEEFIGLWFEKFDFNDDHKNCIPKTNCQSKQTKIKNGNFQ